MMSPKKIMIRRLEKDLGKLLIRIKEARSKMMRNDIYGVADRKASRLAVLKHFHDDCQTKEE